MHACQQRVVLHPCCAASAGGRKSHQYRFVIDEQRIGAGVVWPQRLAVKTCGVWGGKLKSRTVQHNVAGNMVYAQALQSAQQQPQALQHQFGVALTHHHHIAQQSALTHRAIKIHRCTPSVGRAQQVEGGIGGHQFHQRRRVHGTVCTVIQPDRPHALALGQRVAHQHSNRIRGHFSACQCSGNLRRQGLGKGRFCRQ